MEMQTQSPLALNPIFEALQYETVPALKNLLRNPQAFVARVQAQYPPTSPTSLDPDSEEANESATTDEQRTQRAAWVWTQLSPSERQNLLQAVTTLCGTEATQGFQQTVQDRLM